MDSNGIAISISNGIRYLRKVTDAMGGIPNHAPGDPIGIWTTCEVFSILRQVAPLFDNDWQLKLAHFVLDEQLVNGSWPIVRNSIGTTVSTAQGIFAVHAIDDLGKQDLRLSNNVPRSIATGLDWLSLQQNPDGGWGIGKYSEEYTSSRTFPTAFVLTVIDDLNLARNRQAIERGFDYLFSCQNPDGGWGITKGTPSNVASTAKVLSSLSQFDIGSDRRDLERGISYIQSMSDSNPAMAVFEEIVSREADPIIFHHNTPFNLLSLLLIFKIQHQRIEALTRWFLQTQFKDGSWRLGDFLGGMNRTESTWVTAEAVYVLSKVRNSIFDKGEIFNIDN